MWYLWVYNISCSPPQPLQGWSFCCPSWTQYNSLTLQSVITSIFKFHLQSEIQTFILHNVQLRFVWSIHTFCEYLSTVESHESILYIWRERSEISRHVWWRRISTEIVLRERIFQSVAPSSSGRSLFSSNCLLIWWRGGGEVPGSLKLERENNHYWLISSCLWKIFVGTGDNV